jgi:xylulokinase
MKNQYIIAHDLGTSGNKATLYDSSGNLLASDKHAYPTTYLKTGWAEQEPDDWWNAVCNSTKNLIQKSKIDPRDIACTTFSGQMMGCLPVSREGECLYKSIIWADMRSVLEARRLEKEIGRDYVYQTTGTSIAPNYSLEKIMWFKKNHPDIYSGTACFLNAKDYIVYRLTGVFATDYSDASGTNILDIQKKIWSSEIACAAGIDLNKLPPLHASTHIVGYVTRESGIQSGLPAGLPVVIGGGDGPCATVGAGAVEDGDVYNCFGSSSWISVTRKTPLFERNQLTFNLCHLDPDLYMAPGTMQSAGASYEWMKEKLAPYEILEADKMGVSVFEVLEEKAMQSSPGANGLLFLPYLMGERCPYWNPNAKGTLIGLEQRHSRADIIRAVYEGPIFNLRIILDLFKSQGIDCNKITAIGGAVKSSFISQMMADVYEANILRPVILEEATSFGAAIAGGVGVGLFPGFKEVKKILKTEDVFRPIIENSKKYLKTLSVFKASYKALIQVFDELSGLDS